MFAPNYNHDVCSLKCILGTCSNGFHLVSSEPIAPLARFPDLYNAPILSAILLALVSDPTAPAHAPTHHEMFSNGFIHDQYYLSFLHSS